MTQDGIRALSGPRVTKRRWYCPDCHRLFDTGHAFKTFWGSRFHNEVCGAPLIRVEPVRKAS